MYLINEREGQGFKIDLKYYSNFRQGNMWEDIRYNLNILLYGVKYAFLIDRAMEISQKSCLAFSVHTCCSNSKLFVRLKSARRVS